jgi:hypothetical protein
VEALEKIVQQRDKDGIIKMLLSEKPQEPYLYKPHGSVAWGDTSRIVSKSTEEEIVHDD